MAWVKLKKNPQDIPLVKLRVLAQGEIFEHVGKVYIKTDEHDELGHRLCVNVETGFIMHVELGESVIKVKSATLTTEI